MGNIFAIGDIHGCYDKLVALIDQLKINYSQDTVVFLGDYIDRGPDSFQVVDYLLKFKAKHPNTIFLKGNHEALLMRYLTGQDRPIYLVHGGRQTLTSYRQSTMRPPDDPIPPEHIDFFNSLDLYHATDDYIFVHAGIRPGVPMAQQSEDDLLWIRKDFLEDPRDHGMLVVHGHTPVDRATHYGNRLNIDTGAGYGKALTAVVIEKDRVWRLDAGGRTPIRSTG